jgi:regulator of protease activity HflC (stomatin/prohibitin superfamily)
MQKISARLAALVQRPATPSRQPKSKPSTLTPGFGTTLISGIFLLAVGLAILASFVPSGAPRYAALLGSLIAVGGGIYAARYVITALIGRCAVLLLAPYGVQDPAAAQELLTHYLSDEYLPTIAIRQGQVAEGSDVSLLRRKEQMDVSLQRTTGRGPAYLDIDRSSAALIWQPGGYILQQYGLHLYEWNQQFIGAVDLKPQSLPIDEAFWTADGLKVQVKGNISFWIIQDANTLKDSQVHSVKLEHVRRALIPTPDWREKSVRVLIQKLREIVRQFALSDFFVTPDQLQHLDLTETLRRFYSQQASKTAMEEIRTRLVNETRDRLADFGVAVRMIVIDQIAPPSDFVEKSKRMYDHWMTALEKEAELERQARSDLEQANKQYQLAQLEHKTLVIKAETDKEVERLKAEAEAVGLETRMRARAVSAVEFARRMELVRQAFGDRLDEGTMRELMRALGLLVYERRYDREPRSILDMFGRGEEDEDEE